MPIWREDKELSKYSKYKAKTDLAKIGQVVSVLALLARLLGFCWGDCTCSHPLACAFACVFGRCESRVVTVVTGVQHLARTQQKSSTLGQLILCCS